MLSGLTGLADTVRYRAANALAVPFADAGFDVAWSQHVAMTIADRPARHAKIRRVLQPGGCFVVYDVVAGSGEAPHFPVSWSTSQDTGFLLSPDNMRQLLEQQGFRVQEWTNRTKNGVAWVRQQRARASRSGADGKLGRNRVEGRIGLQQALLPHA